MSLVRRSIVSVSWNVLASGISTVIGLIRSILLARWLPVEVFGIYAFANSAVGLTVIATSLGMSSAFIHRSRETENEEEAAATHFTLKLILLLVWMSIVLVVAFVAVEGQTQLALLFVASTTFLTQLTVTPRLILMRRVVHRRLALLQVVDILLSALVALAVAFLVYNLGRETPPSWAVRLASGRARVDLALWALLLTDVVTAFLAVTLLYIYRPVWRPRLTWIPASVRYFLSFGSRTFLAEVLMQALDQIDDLWTGVFLGNNPLSFYSRAYRFASYPRMVLATPINSVAAGTYAELKGKQKRLSQAFFRTNALLIRSGFLLAGLLALLGPEFIRVVLGDKWLPMLDAFRLMLVFTLLDPLKATVSGMFVAVGEPQKVVRARAIQLAVMLVALFLFGIPLGITGVALAVDLMLVVGMVLLFWQAREYVDFSLWGLFGWPAVGLFLALGVSVGMIRILGPIEQDWLRAGVKTLFFLPIYVSILFVFERESIGMMQAALVQALPERIAKRIESRKDQLL